jgi:hypothetical protein
MIYKAPKDYLNLVYWAERGIKGWEVKDGFLLAEYNSRGTPTYIVTYGDIDTCVVRHIKMYSLDKAGAWASIANME